MAAYRRVYDSRHLQADCQEPGSAQEPCARSSSMGYLYLFNPWPWLNPLLEALRYVMYFRFHKCLHVRPEKGDSKKTYTQSDSKGGSMDVTPRRILTLTHMEAAPDRADCLFSVWISSYHLHYQARGCLRRTFSK